MLKMGERLQAVGGAGMSRDEDEIARWYAQWRLPSMQEVRGCVRVRTLISIAGWAKHACLYEFASLAARNENFVYYERSHPEMEAWSVRVVQHQRGRLVHRVRAHRFADGDALDIGDALGRPLGPYEYSPGFFSIWNAAQ